MNQRSTDKRLREESKRGVEKKKQKEEKQKRGIEKKKQKEEKPRIEKKK